MRPHPLTCLKKALSVLFIVSVVSIGPTPCAGPEIEYALKEPLAPNSLLLDGCVLGERIVAVGERGHILLSDDQGKTWDQAKVPTRATLTGLFFRNSDLGWAVGHDAVILRTQDGGENWSRVYSAPEEERPLLDVLFLDDKTGIAVGAYSLFLVSRDGGMNWSPQTISEDDFHLNQITVSEDGTLYIAAEAGNIYTSKDRGLNWDEMPSPYHGSFFSILSLGDESILVFGLRGHMYRSPDNGNSWERIALHTDAMLTDGIVLKDGNVLVVGLSGTVLMGDAQGRHFSLRQQSDRQGISAVVQAKDGALILIGEGGVRRLD